MYTPTCTYMYVYSHIKLQFFERNNKRLPSMTDGIRSQTLQEAISEVVNIKIFLGERALTPP